MLAWRARHFTHLAAQYCADARQQFIRVERFRQIVIRTGIEVTVLATGWLLGGTVGVGTVVYALGIGPLVQLVLRCTPQRWLAASGWAHVVGDRAAEPAVTTMSECPAPSTTTS